MRKHSRKWLTALWMCVCLLVCALAMDELENWMRLVLVLASAAVACVWIMCEARVDRAAAPINLPAEPDPRKDKPPEQSEP